MHIEINDHEIFRIDFIVLQRKHQIHFCYCFFFKDLSHLLECFDGISGFFV